LCPSCGCRLPAAEARARDDWAISFPQPRRTT
jgi:hypothetical protein